MRVQKIRIDRRKGTNHEKGYLHNVTRAFIFRDKKDEERFRFNLQTVAQKPKPEFSFRFHLGNAGSESPIDSHLTILGTGIFWSLGGSRKLANLVQKITTRPQYKYGKYSGRNLSLRIFSGSLWTELWVTEDDMEGIRFPKWRRGSYPITPAEIIWGPRHYFYEVLGSFETEIEMSEGSYPAKLSVSKMFRGRDRSNKRTLEAYVVEVRSKVGIPMRGDASDWKGDRYYGFATTISEEDATSRHWQDAALEAVTKMVLKERADTGFVSPQVD